MNQLICSSAEPPARAIPLPGFEEDSPTREATSRSNLSAWLFAQGCDGPSGKMCPAFFQAGPEKILPPSYRLSPDGRSASRAADGAGPDSSPEHLDATAWVGECLTLNIPEFNNFRGRSRSEGSVLSLRDILETGELSEECSLTGKCVAGILRRAAIREDLLPKGLAAALANASRLT